MDPRGTLEAAVAALSQPLVPLDDAVGALEREPGLVAWWAPATVLSPVGGAPHPVDDVRLLAVGEATMLRNRVTRQDLYRTGVSAVRRMLAGLLLDELALAPTWVADVVLPRADEDRLTVWMRAHLQLSWTVREDRRELLAPVVDAMAPGLRTDDGPGREAEQRFVAAAGHKADRVLDVPFRRP